MVFDIDINHEGCQFLCRGSYNLVCAFVCSLNLACIEAGNQDFDSPFLQ